MYRGMITEYEVLMRVIRIILQPKIVIYFGSVRSNIDY